MQCKVGLSPGSPSELCAPCSGSAAVQQRAAAELLCLPLLPELLGSASPEAFLLFPLHISSKYMLELRHRGCHSIIVHWELGGFSQTRGKFWTLRRVEGVGDEEMHSFQFRKCPCCVQASVLLNSTSATLWWHSQHGLRCCWPCQLLLGRGWVRPLWRELCLSVAAEPLLSFPWFWRASGSCWRSRCLPGEAVLFSSQCWTLLTRLERHDSVLEDKSYSLYVQLSVILSHS